MDKGVAFYAGSHEGLGGQIDENISFMEQLLERNGKGQSTVQPPDIVQVLDGKPPISSSSASREEAQIVILDVVENAMTKAYVKAKEINIFAINC